MGKGAKTKGFFKNLENNTVFTFMYNPESFKDSQSFNYVGINAPCSSYPVFQYVGTSERSLTFNLFAYGDVKTVGKTVSFFDSIRPNKRFDVPPRLLFVFGKTSKTVIISKIDREFLEYDKELNVKGVQYSLTLIEL